MSKKAQLLKTLKNIQKQLPKNEFTQSRLYNISLKDLEVSTRIIETFSIYEDKSFVVKYSKIENKLKLETTYSNQIIDEEFVEKLNTILKIIKTF